MENEAKTSEQETVAILTEVVRRAASVRGDQAYRELPTFVVRRVNHAISVLTNRRKVQ